MSRNDGQAFREELLANMADAAAGAYWESVKAWADPRDDPGDASGEPVVFIVDARDPVGGAFLSVVMGAEAFEQAIVSRPAEATPVFVVPFPVPLAAELAQRMSPSGRVQVCAPRPKGYARVVVVAAGGNLYGNVALAATTH